VKFEGRIEEKSRKLRKASQSLQFRKLFPLENKKVCLQFSIRLEKKLSFELFAEVSQILKQIQEKS
jgi:hypothetical protein